MQVSLTTTGGLERRLEVAVPGDRVNTEVESRLKQLSRTARLKGFRPGKAPLAVIQKQFGEQVRSEVVSDLIRSSYSEAVNQEKLNPAGGPRIEPLAGPDAAAAEHFTYRATFEVYPEFTLKDLGELAIDVPSVDVEEPDLDAMIEKLRGQRATWAVVERSAAEGDRVTVDFTGTIDGQPFEGGEGKGIGILVGSGQVLKDFDAALRGNKAGDSTTATVPFPQDYPTQSLAGKTAQFAIDLKKVEERKLPELDDAFADSFGLAGGAGALRGEVRNNMERELKERLRAETKTRAFDALIGANNIVVPRALVEQEITTLQEQALRQMGSSDPQQAPPRERLEGTALRRVTIGLLIQELLREHKIKLDQPRVEQRIKELAAPYEKPDEAAQFYRSDRGMMTQVEASVLEDQVVDFLLERARCTTKNVSFKDFMGA